MADSRVAPPSSDEYAQFYAGYVRRVLHTEGRERRDETVVVDDVGAEAAQPGDDLQGR